MLEIIMAKVGKESSRHRHLYLESSIDDAWVQFLWDLSPNIAQASQVMDGRCVPRATLGC